MQRKQEAYRLMLASDEYNLKQQLHNKQNQAVEEEKKDIEQSEQTELSDACFSSNSQQQQEQRANDSNLNKEQDDELIQGQLAMVMDCDQQKEIEEANNEKGELTELESRSRSIEAFGFCSFRNVNFVSKDPPPNEEEKVGESKEQQRGCYGWEKTQGLNIVKEDESEAKDEHDAKDQDEEKAGNILVQDNLSSDDFSFDEYITEKQQWCEGEEEQYYGDDARYYQEALYYNQLEYYGQYYEQPQFKIVPIPIQNDDMTPHDSAEDKDVDFAGNQQDRCYIMNTIEEEDESATVDDDDRAEAEDDDKILTEKQINAIDDGLENDE